MSLYLPYFISLHFIHFDSFYGSRHRHNTAVMWYDTEAMCANQSCMTLALVRCSIEADQGGTLHARARVSLVSWEGRSHAVLFMVPLGPPGARPMAQELRLPFEYLTEAMWLNIHTVKF